MRNAFDFSGQRILVTGASGFLGLHLCRSLTRLGGIVHGLSRKTQANQQNLQWWHGDLSDFTTTRTFLNKINPDVIFHLTTHGWGAPGLEHVLPSLRSDLIATVNLLTAAAELEIRRLVVTASLEEPLPGDPEVVPSSPYAVAKWASGAYARMFHHLYGTPAVIVRIFMTYGPQQPIQKIIPYTILSLLKGETPKISNGKRLIDWIYVDDVIRGLLAAAQVSDIEGSTIDLGSGKLVSIRDIAEQVVDLLRSDIRASFGALPSSGLEPIRAANVSDTYERIGWKAAINLSQGLERTIDWYRAQIQNPNELRTVAAQQDIAPTYASPEIPSRS